ncbi:MAG TPA: bifunctional methylenetetrahydrofolate dehydrogenase/methenyltetrahydrofolate cyclohydrolase FolD [Polyangiaceae bacterium]|nr:bifunctional methylenetetrahydrofolate dehydrogenase/methenyltetrahydrofolate cyclohydrolase FolD [Polyangiaceae bacterium]
MPAQTLHGKPIAAKVRAEVASGVAQFRDAFGRAPGLDVILVGDDPASQVYVRNKEKAALEVGMRGRAHRLSATATEAEVRSRIDELNADDEVDGFLVQLPLPAGLPETALLDAVLPSKDVDGLHPLNAGLLALGRAKLVSATPRGVMRLLAETGTDLVGKRAVIIGRSNIVGKPLAQLLLGAHATVTIGHSRTRDLAGICREADVLVAAVGRPGLVRGDWIKPGAVVIDIGTTRNDAGKLTGDVVFDEACEHAAWITPVPGGVGPMTIACLLENTLLAARERLATGKARR